jgi:leader peptidase (prepilin peptidase)/N-methyltransferase
MLERTFNPEIWAAVPFHFWSLCFFTFGCMIGSFLNVCIHRMPLEQSVVSPPSHCPHCKYSIPWYLNLPLITWLWLRGKCANCKAPISIRYFLVELLTGVLFLGCWLGLANPDAPIASMPLALAACVFTAGLVVATFIDFEHFIIPDGITIGGMMAGFLLSLAAPALHGPGTTFTGAILSSGIGVAFGSGLIYGIVWMGKLLFGRQHFRLEPGAKITLTESALQLPGREIPYEEIFYRDGDNVTIPHAGGTVFQRNGDSGETSIPFEPAELKLTTKALTIGEQTFDPETIARVECTATEVAASREAMGFGDVKFMGAIGAFIGPMGVVFTLTASAIIGAVVGGSLIALRQREASTRIPFGPYLAVAALIWLFAREPIVNWLLPPMP